MRAPRRAARLALALALAAGWVAGPALAEDPDPPAALGLMRPDERLPAPDFRLEALAGAPDGPGAHAGELILLNFWATWCRPCVQELPALEALWRDYGGRGLTVLAVNLDRGRRKHVARYAARLNLTLPVLLDARGAARRAYEVRAMPTTYLIGRDGRFLGRVLGDRPWDDPAHRAALEALLGAGP